MENILKPLFAKREVFFYGKELNCHIKFYIANEL